ncbi:MAG: hypothetical protein P9X24_05635, partial [Candidatus Hatepunaea meridiana]|nr:hypothetical protein [Candidatus Hatepunaea meridiana]
TIVTAGLMILLIKSTISELPSHFVIPAKAGIQSFQVFNKHHLIGVGTSGYPDVPTPIRQT